MHPPPYPRIASYNISHVFYLLSHMYKIPTFFFLPIRGDCCVHDNYHSLVLLSHKYCTSFTCYSNSIRLIQLRQRAAECNWTWY
ncbi:hypothetical protein COCCADRAFT_91206 [Bipolaris zeicola 26-R-13]|uniref:Uncharacterized protein n=1 Tax=Cochliobolus carbonum (strain 26-R-13) TaxID=930089 RepID=W6Y6X6_COCC2|nr:uncharacterized protein COCCADRAFT_91206 [Bipolaris zeicola 26-R-13]EUC35332.1 hypothetical protein COCCADRAFT_91206 [Bipolaris zeicola 26-R-13]